MSKLSVLLFLAAFALCVSMSSAALHSRAHAAPYVADVEEEEAGLDLIDELDAEAYYPEAHVSGDDVAGDEDVEENLPAPVHEDEAEEDDQQEPVAAAASPLANLAHAFADAHDSYKATMDISESKLVLNATCVDQSTCLRKASLSFKPCRVTSKIDLRKCLRDIRAVYSSCRADHTAEWKKCTNGRREQFQKCSNTNFKQYALCRASGKNSVDYCESSAFSTVDGECKCFASVYAECGSARKASIADCMTKRNHAVGQCMCRFTTQNNKCRAVRLADKAECLTAPLSCYYNLPDPVVNTTSSDSSDEGASPVSLVQIMAEDQREAAEDEDMAAEYEIDSHDIADDTDDVDDDYHNVADETMSALDVGADVEDLDAPAPTATKAHRTLAGCKHHARRSYDKCAETTSNIKSNCKISAATRKTTCLKGFSFRSCTRDVHVELSQCRKDAFQAVRDCITSAGSDPTALDACVTSIDADKVACKCYAAHVGKCRKALTTNRIACSDSFEDARSSCRCTESNGVNRCIAIRDYALHACKEDAAAGSL